jgi:hypothetical protein
LNTEQQATASLWSADEASEDYYNEGNRYEIDICRSMPRVFIVAIVNRSGHECPYSLKLIVCLVLYEITSFLRETYPTLPKVSSAPVSAANSSRQQRPHQATTNADAASTTIDKRSSDCARVHSFVSQTSNRSISSIASNKQQPGKTFETVRNNVILGSTSFVTTVTHHHEQCPSFGK